MTLFFAVLSSLLSIINPLGASPVFLSLTIHAKGDWVKKQLQKACLNLFFILLISFLVGNYFMHFFGISIEALKIGGGLIVARAGFILLNGRRKKEINKSVKKESILKDDISFSPLAMPLLSGPGAISIAITYSFEAHFFIQHLIFCVALLVAVLITYIILSMSTYLTKFMGEAGINVMNKLMGFITICIGIQFLINGILTIVADLK